jgi:predicted P-loop ATPase
MQQKELNKLKAAMTMPSINERAAYARYHENRPHLASFCGTGNNVQFLSDTTGTRRWLPFEVVSIESPLSSPSDYDGIYAQAHTLYQQGFRYWFDKPEIERLQRHNEAYETVHSELELIDLHFRKPVGDEPRQLVSATMALQMIGGNIAQTLSKEKIGQAFTRLGFEYRRTTTQRGYIAVHRTGVEMETYRRKLAEDGASAMTDDSMTADS